MNGTPVRAALVSVHDSRAGRRWTVYTDEDGAYRLSGLPDGPLTLEVRGAEAESQPRHVAAVERGHDAGTIELPPLDPALEPPASAFLAQLPDGTEKNRFIVDCGGCHTFSSTHARFEGRERTEEEWSDAIARMLGFAGPATGFPIISAAAHADVDASWLAASLAGAPWPETVAIPDTLVAGSDAVLTEYELPEPADLPHDVAVMPDGRILVTGMMTHRMYVLDPETGSFETEAIPQQYANPRAVDITEDGAWIVALGAPRSVAVRSPDGGWSTHAVGLYPHSVALDTDGGVWVNGHFSVAPEIIARLDPESGTVERFTVPPPVGAPVGAPSGRESTIPYGLRVAPDGIVWGTQLRGNRLVRLDPATGDVTTWDLPEEHSGPRRPDVGPDGSVWIPLFGAGKLASFDPSTEAFTLYDVPVADAGPYVVRVDRARNTVWLGTGHADVVFSFDPASERFTAYPLPTRGALVRHLDIDEGTGVVWVAYGASPGIPAKILRIEP